MVYLGQAPSPPRFWGLWEAFKERLRTQLGPADPAAVYRYGETDIWEGAQENQWWRVAIVPVTTAFPTQELAGRFISIPFLIRTEVHMPTSAPAHPKLEDLQADAFAALHGWKPEGLNFAKVQRRIWRESPPQAMPLWDDERDLWYLSAQYRVVVEPA